MTASTEPDDDTLAQALHRSRALEDAPEALIQRAIDVFQPRTPARPAPGLRQRLTALLSFDSGAGADGAAGAAMAGDTALGLRSGGAMDPTRQLLFTADGRDIDLRIAPAADGLHWQVSGQVLGPDAEGSAELTAGGTCLQAAWNDLAEFRFEQVPGGDCSLVLRSADWELELPTFQTAAPR